MGAPITVQDDNNLNKADWYIDCWIMPTNLATGSIVNRRTDTGQTNYCLRLINNVPQVEFTSGGGIKYVAGGNAAIPMNAWSRLTAVYRAAQKSLELTINDVLKQAQATMDVPAQGDGTVTIGDPGLYGYLDNLAIDDPPQSYDVVFTLDVSGSMAGDRLSQMKGAAQNAIDILPEGTPIGIVSFSDSATLLTDGFETDKTELKNIISGLTAGGGTAYSPALSQALSLVTAHSTADRHLEIFISDGAPGDNPSDTEILQSADAGITIYTIGFQLDDPTQLQRLSSLTGGEYFDAPTAADLQTAFEEIFASRVFNVEYLFDDDAVTAEDFRHQLDWTYALTNVVFDETHFYETSIVDEDYDGLPDWWEILFFGDDIDPMEDTDGDGLNNLYEYLSDTNPRTPDSDNNGVLDINEDYDGDGLKNQDEQTHGSDPRLADTDEGRVLPVPSVRCSYAPCILVERLTIM